MKGQASDSGLDGYDMGTGLRVAMREMASVGNGRRQSSWEDRGCASNVVSRVDVKR